MRPSALLTLLASSGAVVADPIPRPSPSADADADANQPGQQHLDAYAYPGRYDQ